jgi:hypothetical protein
LTQRVTDGLAGPSGATSRRIEITDFITSVAKSVVVDLASPRLADARQRPGLAVALPSLRAIHVPLKRAFDKIDAHLNAWVNNAQLAHKT